jgi:methylphosphotriester-DNA--protein-cysteine methyltransferase
MNSEALKTHGDRVNQFARSVPNLGRLGEMTRAIVDMLRSNDWRDYRDATGAYHFQAGEFDYFLALQTVNARDVARLYLTAEERTEIATAMDRTRTGDRRYRRSVLEVVEAHPHAGQSLTTYWERYGWSQSKYPVGARAIVRARTGVTFEEHARQTRIKRLRQLGEGWRDRVARVVAAAEGFTREELLAAIDALKELAQRAPKLGQSDSAARVRRLRAKGKKR